MYLKVATKADIDSIQQIADIAFRDTYQNILSEEQLSYMLNMMYSTKSLEEQLDGGQEFILLRDDDGQYLGFVSYEPHYKHSKAMKLHKLYVLPETKGRGLGRILIETVFDKARKHGSESVQLNMNRNNSTYGFYLHMGFVLVGNEDIDIGQGYLMEDYIFEKKI